MKNINFIFLSISVILISLYLAITIKPFANSNKESTYDFLFTPLKIYNGTPYSEAKEARPISNLHRSKEGFQIGTAGITTLCDNKSTDSACYDITYIDPASSKEIHAKAKIDPNYYIDAKGMLNMVPYGYIPSADKKSYIPKSKKSIYEKNAIDKENQRIQDSVNQITDANYNKNLFSSQEKQVDFLNKQKLSATDENQTSNKTYNSDNVNISYHAEPTLNTDEGAAGVGKMWIKDNSGNLISVPYSDVSNTTLYYQTGSYPFGPSSYVPNYEESVFLSKLTNKPTVSQIYDFASQKGGFCEGTKSSMFQREQKCNQTDVNTCASTDCCVLLGGEKCVAGNMHGPSIKANYSDFLLVNRDYYYYKGKCYGNCS
jgi:hypothetical protein